MAFLPANALVGLAAAASWGGGDFSGGMGVKAAGGTLGGALRVIVVAHAASLAVLCLVVAVLSSSSWPQGAPLAWALCAGVAAGLSLTAFYLALAQGAMGASAAISGLLAAAIPVAVSVLLEGAPGWIKTIGFVVALAAIWLIAAGEASEPGAHEGRRTLALSIFGGIGFGIYFVGLQRSNTLGVFEPIMIARAASLATCLLLLVFIGMRDANRAKSHFPGRALFWAGGVALLDTGGNLLFIAATRLGRLDVAAVLASLYPAATILLAAWQLHERPARNQLFGMVLALIAVVLITI